MVYDSKFKTRLEKVIERIEETSEYKKLQQFEENRLNSPPTVDKESAIHYTPVDLVNQILAATTAVGMDWKEAGDVLSIFEKTGVWASLMYTYIRVFGESDSPEKKIHIAFPRQTKKAIPLGIFENITNSSLPDENIHTADLGFQYDNSTVAKSLYSEEEETPIIDEFFDPVFAKRNRKHVIKSLQPLMKFDFIAGNPPYEASQEYDGKKGGGTALWPEFTNKSIDLLKDGGHLAFVHPPLWRKPQSESSWCADLQPKMFSQNIKYLSIHNSNEGEKVLGADTRFDWYVMEKGEPKVTTVIDENGKSNRVDTSKYECLPNSSFDLWDKLVASDGEEKSSVIFDYSSYETRKDWTAKENKEDYQYPLVHSTAERHGGKKVWYSSLKDNGHFGVPKVIFGDSASNGVHNAIKDVEGNYGMTQHAIAVPVEDEDEADDVKEALESDAFEKFIKATMWSGSGYQIDWRMFEHFKKDWYETVLQIEEDRKDD